MNYESATIGHILSRVNEDIFIPGIQRPYVWEPEQIIKLFDSLMRGYPINSFLFWELRPENFGDWDIYRFVQRFRQGDIHNDRAELSADGTITLVLDGQQRLTSLLIGLEGSYTTRFKRARKNKDSSWYEDALYLDLLQLPGSDMPGEQDDSAVKDVHYGFKFADATIPPKSSGEHLWFRVSQIMQVRNRGGLDAFIEHQVLLHPHLPTPLTKVLKKNLTRLYEVVWEVDCISYYLEKDQAYDKVLDIFIRANDGGTKLSKSDLFMSMVTLRWERVHAREATEALTYHLRDTLQHDKSFDRDFLLRAGLFFNDLSFAFSLSNFTPRNIATIENTWPQIDAALRMSASLFRRANIVGGHLTAANVVMLIGCYIYKLNKGLPLEEWRLVSGDEERIRRWVICVLFHGVLGGAANVTMERYRNLLNEAFAHHGSFPAAALVEGMTKRGRVMDFDDGAVLRFCQLDAGGRLGLPCLSLLYDGFDWASDGRFPVQIVPAHRLKTERLESLNIPAEDIPRYQDWANKLANFALMSQADKREYNQMDYEDWIASRDETFLRRHVLPTDFALYDERRFIEFIAARKRMINVRLRTLFTDATAGAGEQSAASFAS